MNISHIAPTYSTQIQKYAGNSKAVEPEKKQVNRDSVSISKEGAKLSKASSAPQTVAVKAAESPEIRWEKVNLARKRMTEGFYNTEQFKGELAGKLAGDFIAQA